MVFSDDLKLFACEVKNQDYRGIRLLVWDAATGSDICTVPLDYINSKLTAFTFLPGGHTLVTACDPAPEQKMSVALRTATNHVPLATPNRRPVASTNTRAIIEFWDIDHLVWHKEKVNLFPRKIKTCYLEGDDDIHYMTASLDGKLLYMRSGKKIMDGKNVLPIANGYIFALDPDNPPNLPAEILLNDVAVVHLSD